MNSNVSYQKGKNERIKGVADRDREYIKLDVTNVSLKKVPLAPLLLIALIVETFFLGIFFTKVQYLEKERSFSPDSAVTNAAQEALPTNDTSPKKVSIDDDPVLGNKNAKVTLIEFSDFECPFCKKFFLETFPKLKKEYIDTGKVKFVYRDLPLDFHQNAHKEAQAAECARDQGGDVVFFKYHDEIFKRTTSNGTGLALDQLPIIAQELGLDTAKLSECLDSKKYQQEVDKDLSDASAVGATATPTFFIGKTTDSGTINGQILVGALPFNSFKILLDQQLQ